MIDFHREMIRIHRSYSAFRTGSIKMLAWSENVLAYARFNGREQCVVIIHNGDKVKEVRIPVWPAEIPRRGTMRRLLYTWDDDYTMEHEEYLIKEGIVAVNMNAHSALVLKKM